MTSGPQINQPKEYLTSFKSGVEQDSRIEAYTVHPHCWNTKCNNYLHTAKHCHKTPKSVNLAAAHSLCPRCLHEQ
nr:uncharacterized protein LOC107128809 isoform X2 [Macaca fascicularis]